MISLLFAATVKLSLEDPDALLGKMRAAYHEVHSALFYVRFTATDPKGKQISGEARYEYVSPNKFRAAFKGATGGKAILISDGSHIAIFSTTGRRDLMPYSPSGLTSHLPTNVETLAFFNSDKCLSRDRLGEMHGSELTIIESKEWKSKQWRVLREINRQDFVQVDYYIDPKTNLIWRTLGEDLKTHKPFIDAEVLELESNVKIDVSRFKIPTKKS